MVTFSVPTVAICFSYIWSSVRVQCVKEARQLTAKASAKQMRKECHRDIHKFACKILDKDNYTSIQPSFGQEQAEEYFSRVYSTTPKTFSHPEWMPECPQPSVTAPFTEEEVRGSVVVMVVGNCNWL